MLGETMIEVSVLYSTCMIGRRGIMSYNVEKWIISALEWRSILVTHTHIICVWDISLIAHSSVSNRDFTSLVEKH